MSDSSFDDGVSSLTSLAPSIDPIERRKRTQQGSQTQAEVVKRTAESPEPATVRLVHNSFLVRTGCSSLTG
jgi:hypothetical protein